MNTNKTIWIILGILGALVILCGCGVSAILATGAWAVTDFVQETNLRITTDPGQVSKLGADIADYSVPDGYHADYGMSADGIKFIGYTAKSDDCHINLGREIVFEQAFGIADLETQAPLATEAILPIGSITKTFIVTLLMQLAEQGVVSLADPLGCYLPEYPHSATTLRQLAAHTSGLPRDAAVNYPMNYTIGAWPASGGQTPMVWYVPTDRLLASLPAVELETPPDSGKVYSNLGICLLAIALERATGQPIQHLLAERIFAPLGMAASELVFSHRELSPAMAGRLPPGYVFTDQGRLPAPLWELGCAGYTGGICCTAGDLARYLAFHLAPQPTDRVLTPVSVRRICPAHSSGDAFLGWWKGWYGGRENFGHDGGHVGYLAAALGISDVQLGVVTMTNRFNPARFENHGTEIARKLLEILASQVAALPQEKFDPAAVEMLPC
ncbi:MAG: serine hydrolase domain-containing protein [Chloroflexota bacterium]